MFFAFRKPSLGDPFALLEEFADGPEQAGTEHAEQTGHDHMADTERGNDAGNAQYEEKPPGAGAKIILGLYDDGVEYPNDEESSYGYDNTCEKHENNRN